MDTSFKTESKVPVERYRIRFNTKEGFEKACEKIRASGYLRFRQGGDHILIGRPVRVKRIDFTIELDAAQE